MRQRQRRLPASDTLTKTEAAARAQVTPRTISRWIEQGHLTRYTVQINRVAVSKRQLDTLLRGRAS
jgi:excisionase family DNA binding protein